MPVSVHLGDDVLMNLSGTYPRLCKTSDFDVTDDLDFNFSFS